jgi:predicted metal-dependent hydrolase
VSLKGGGTLDLFGQAPAARPPVHTVTRRVQPARSQPRQLELGGVVLEIVQKKIKYLRLSVHPPAGAVRVSAPLRASAEAIRLFVTSRLDWIRRQQAQLRARELPAAHAFLDGEIHSVWGQPCRLEVIERDGATFVELKDGTLLLHTRPGSSAIKRGALLVEWYRGLIEAAAPILIAKWEPLMQVTVARVSARHMKTRWGSCTPRSRQIRLSVELAKKPPQCLEYVVVHEMVHLLEASHNRRFVRLMDRFMPPWRSHRRELNRRPGELDD